MVARTDCTSRDGILRFEKTKKLVAAWKWQSALSAKNAGEADFLSSTIYAQQVASLYGEAGIIIRQSTFSGSAIIPRTSPGCLRRCLMNLALNKNSPTIMHIDLNSCYATVEQQANPLLRGKPIAVAAYTTPGGCIVSPSIDYVECKSSPQA